VPRIAICVPRAQAQTCTAPKLFSRITHASSSSPTPPQPQAILTPPASVSASIYTVYSALLTSVHPYPHGPITILRSAPLARPSPAVHVFLSDSYSIQVAVPHPNPPRASHSRPPLLRRAPIQAPSTSRSMGVPVPSTRSRPTALTSSRTMRPRPRLRRSTQRRWSRRPRWWRRPR
jgi:hypothetical protein